MTRAVDIDKIVQAELDKNDARPPILPIRPKWAAAISRVKDGGPHAWDRGFSRCGGAISRMFHRMRDAGLIEGPPYKPTKKGLAALAAFEEMNKEAVS